MEANIKSEQEHIRMREKSMNKDSSSSLTDSEDDDKKKRAATSSSTKKVAGTTSSSKSCQAERCTADLSGARTYHRRHKVCELHAKAPAVLVAGLRQRFCQQCSRFHELLEFDDSKRSCRRRLAGHNERRRKNSGEINNSSLQAAEGSRNLPFNVQENANYNNHFNVTR